MYFLAAPLGVEMFDGGDMGREKLREGLVGLDGLASASSDSATLDSLLACRDVVGGGLFTRSVPCPEEGDVTRWFGSKLDALLCLWCAFAGIGGIGGAPESNDIVLRSGSSDDARNVRSVIEPLLLDLCRSGRLPPRIEPIPLPFDEVDPLLTMRLVCRFPTGSGEVVWERRAAAAAADEREAVDFDV